MRPDPSRKPDPSHKIRRCAIYTRVSSDSGLEQDFNSLDAQREASQAYIKSQAHEGWRPTRERYDDGGFSGGSTARPALQRLLEDVRAHRIDTIVVYKVDRLTRSLMDFANLVALFDEKDVSFVSVTQSFNTTTSMGRLTLNVLLSFAQFEREVTGERIRDKIAASKKKGIWMGGVVPLGYRVEARALHVVEAHADIVRTIFRDYLTMGSVVRLKHVLDQNRLRLPHRTDGAGRTTGGGLLHRGHLYKILTNPIYIGRLRHKGEIHAGQHAPIVSELVWDQVQQMLSDHTRATHAKRRGSAALLTGKLFDDQGNRMTPTYAQKGNRRWRYYVSQAILQGEAQRAGSVTRVPAQALESIILTALAERLAGRPPSGSGPSLVAFLERAVVTATTIDLAMNETAQEKGIAATLSVPWRRPTPVRRQIIPIEGGGDQPVRPMRVEAHAKLLVALRNAHGWLDELLGDPSTSIESIAAREGRSERSIRQTLSLAFVAPDIVKAAVDRRLSRGLNASRLMDLPQPWHAQRRMLGLSVESAI